MGYVDDTSPIPPKTKPDPNKLEFVPDPDYETWF